MAELKTRPTPMDVKAYIASLGDEKRQSEASVLLELFTTVTGYDPVMWGDSIIGFGRYDYQNTAGNYQWPVTGFAIRKRNLTLYIMQGFSELEAELAELGPHKIAKSCLYLTRLSRVNVNVLETLLQKSVKGMQQRYSCTNLRRPEA